MKRISFLILLFVSFFAFSQEEVEIPKTMKFADMELKFSDGLRKKLSEEVKSLTQNKKYLQIKLDRADFYFPIIDRVFDEEGFFHDFKYLCLQESSLISDAVSTSNAVGFWQFKKETAQEVGLTVNSEIDERKHISASTRGAIKYLKRNNFYFNNWIYAVMAYNTGVGGAKNLVDEKEFGAKKMNLDEKTHWYIIKFLAHKIAFENLLGKNHSPAMHAIEYLPENENSLSSIADKTKVDLEQIKEYNKWLSSSRIPSDKPITVIVPTKAEEKDKVVNVLGKNVISTGSTQTYYALSQKNEPVVKEAIKETPKYNPTGKDKEAYTNASIHSFFKWNGIKSVLAKNGDTPAILANAAGISLNKLLKYNDIKSFDNIIPGKNYYLKAKKSKAKVSYHIVKEGETIWSISQDYGVKKSKILQKNRMKESDYLEPGRKLWMKEIRPENVEIEIVKQATKPKQETLKPNLPIQKPLETPKTNEDDKIVYQQKGTATTITVIDTLLYKTHLVAESQTMYSISKMYNTSLDSLVKWNNSTQINVGQSLIVGRKIKDISGKNNYIKHKVVAGETLYKIAKQYYVTLEQIKQWNNKTADTVSLGEELKIYTK
jgi:membrane-bound lytic murein transglycosylase D